MTPRINGKTAVCRVLGEEVVSAGPFDSSSITAKAAIRGSRKSREDTQKLNAGSQLAYATLEESRDRYRDLYTFAPIGYLTLTSDSVISEANLAGAGMLLGGSRKKLLHTHFSSFVMPGERSRFFHLIRQAKADGVRHSCALELLRSDGTTFHAQLDCVREEIVGAQPKARLIVTDLTERKRMEQKIETLAFYDHLTGLPNRRLLLDRMSQAAVAAARTQSCGAVLMIDLDDFKTINDTQGHDAGDELLRQAALRLTACVRASDTVARLGGDEFVVLLEGLSCKPIEAAAQARRVGEKILGACNARYLFGAEDYRNSGSVGTTLFGSNRESVKELLKRADLALYRAKGMGGNLLQFFETEMQEEVTIRVALENDLRHALTKKQFVLHYQLQVDARGVVIGVEGLVRWQHPTRGFLLPGEFIPLAEEKGYIVPLGQWVLETACSQLVAWSGDDSKCDLTISINISPYEFRELKFVDQVLDVILRTGADPRKLVLEITESAILGNLEATVAKISSLKMCGLRFSIDDFGVGYSSLTYLKNLPLDQLKIDRSFIHDIATNSKDAAIAESIIALGKNLGISVIAEGVETGRQRDLLVNQGCCGFQGFLFGKPGPAEHLNLSGPNARCLP